MTDFALNQIEVRHDEAAHRFEADIQGLTAVLVYKIVPGRMLIQHTEVPPVREGR